MINQQFIANVVGRQYVDGINFVPRTAFCHFERTVSKHEQQSGYFTGANG